MQKKKKNHNIALSNGEVHGCYRRSAKRKGEKKKTRGRRRALERFGVWRNGREKKGGKKENKERVRVRV